MHKSFVNLIFAALVCCIPLVSADAQPPNKKIWVDRTIAYARWWGGDPNHQITNPEYGMAYNNQDCANFVSQILQAGCAGFCEENSLHPTVENEGAPFDNHNGWAGDTYAVECNAWHDDEGNADNGRCYDITEDHKTIVNAKLMKQWLDATHADRVNDGQINLWPGNSVESVWTQDYYENDKNAWPPGEYPSKPLDWSAFRRNGVSVGYVVLIAWLKSDDEPLPESPATYTELPDYDNAAWHFHAMFVTDMDEHGWMKYSAHNQWRVDASLTGIFIWANRPADPNNEDDTKQHGWVKLFFYGGGLDSPLEKD
jgi:hypothetical protein